jgi:hypothetical protein
MLLALKLCATYHELFYFLEHTEKFRSSYHGNLVGERRFEKRVLIFGNFKFISYMELEFSRPI